jgi:hypothetical protein
MDEEEEKDGGRWGRGWGRGWGRREDGRLVYERLGRCKDGKKEVGKDMGRREREGCMVRCKGLDARIDNIGSREDWAVKCKVNVETVN